ncbi:hypothetical protein CAEBREN_20075 [Caenorhabditis brenneri]|uniref:Ribosomal RNA-processing protein 43 n=1 Tax=Caenorhabditis brenneri TaxID=135651 RepID=G0NQZ9_CAEBE|nr:hypothetical protein CAEBREN_20075 [Caenorhabditis brenneri]
MLVDEISQFDIECIDLVQYPFVSKKLRDIAKTCDGKHSHVHTTHMCAASVAQGTGYNELDELMKNPRPLRFVFHLLKVFEPNEYEHESWQLGEEDKLKSVEELRQKGNDLFVKKESEDLSNLLLPLFSNGSFILRENLRCLDVNGKPLPLEWQLFITVNVLCLEGNLLDAVVCAIRAALADTKLPSIVLNHSEGDESAIEKSQIQVDYRTMYKLILDEPLMCCSFGVFVDNDSKKKSEILLMTPDIEATSVCRATCSVVIGKGDRIALVRERGRITSFSLLKV